MKQFGIVVGAWVSFFVRLLDVMRCNRSPCANESLAFLGWILGVMEHFYNQIAKIQS